MRPPVAGVAHRPLLVRWGLPRDPRATELVIAFALATVATVVLTRAFLELTGYPTVGGSALHVAHVLWGGLAMALAVVLALSFAGPAARPIVAIVGGVGFGLFIDEVGKFLTHDNDYFFAPAPMIMYATLVLLVMGADALHAKRGMHRSELLAAAADYAVAGIAGGLSPQRRAEAHELLERAGAAHGHREVSALLEVIAHDERDAPDPVAAVRNQLRSFFALVVRQKWTWPAILALSGVLFVVSITSITVAVRDASHVRWAVAATIASLVLVAACWLRAWTLRGQRIDALDWLRRGVHLNLLLTQIAVFRLHAWWGTVGLLVALVLLGIIGAERVRDHHAAGVALDDGHAGPDADLEPEPESSPGSV